MNKEEEQLILIDYKNLSQPALDGLINDFILREGTDYGLHEYSLEQKNAQVLKQLECGDVIVSFDSKSESCTLLNKKQLAELKPS